MQCPSCGRDARHAGPDPDDLKPRSVSRSEVGKTRICDRCGTRFEVRSMKECPFTAGCCDGEGCMAWHPTLGCLLVRPPIDISALSEAMRDLQGRLAELEAAHKGDA